MFAKTLVLISTVIASSVLMAAEGGEHGGGHYSELLPKIVNFGLVFGFMLWKIKKPVSEMFTKNSRDVSSLFQVAEQKDKEAQIKLETYERKLASVAAEKGKILENAQAEASAFEKKISMERIDSVAPGSVPENWADNDSTISQQGLDAEKNPIFGTPKAKNSAITLEI